MKEYRIEGNEEVDLTRLRTGFIPQESFKYVHRFGVIPCHDVFIWYQGGILLVERDNVPAKGDYFPIGGRIQRGIPIEESLRLKAKEECNLDLEAIAEIGVARTFWREEPFGHRRGTDSINVVYSARGRGELKLDGLHKNPAIVTIQTYSDWRDFLHPYVRDFMDIIFLRK